MKKTQITSGLRGGTALSALVLASALFAAPAFAQDATTAKPQPQVAAAATPDQSVEDDSAIVVTGSMLRRTDAETPSPVTVITADDLEKRGITTIEDAIQKLSANSAGTLTNSFGANGAFASGASAASLRGLSTANTLVLFDGLRAAYYPLADDGTRNFVDLNTVQGSVIDRIEVLKDGASSTYGADAVAGVINIITKKQITGFSGRVEAGISEHGDAGNQRVSATYGIGDLAESGFNFYVSGEYQKQDQVYARQRGYPYNTADLSKLCAPSVGTATIAAGTTTCRTNSVANGIQFDGTYGGLGTTTVPVVRPYNATNTTAVPGSVYTFLNPGAGCRELTAYTLTPAQLGANPTQSVVCQQDLRQMYSVLTPDIERLGGTARLTVDLGRAQAYAMFNFYQTRSNFDGTPQLIRANTPAGGVQFTTGSIALPVYVCARNGASATYVNNVPTTPGCTAANGTLNPNNPFAAAGQTARILYRLADIPLSNERLTRTYRGALGISGSFGDDWNYSLEGLAMRQNLKATYNGYIYVQHLLDVVADGSYNFVNPSQNSQAVRDYLAPQRINNSHSEMYQVQASLAKDLFQLPGGPLQVGIGGSFRYESVIAPSANPVPTVAGPQTQRYFTINGFGTSGSRKVYSAYFEVNAPIVDQLEINASGRYDDYSSGQSNFSPKIGAKFTPIRELAIRGTYSRGFRIPSFAEAYGLPTTGYITQTPPSAYQTACKNLQPFVGGVQTAPSYCTAQYSVGLTSIGNPNLRPEKSRSFTGGVIFEPVRGVSFSVDYYNIRKTDLITGADYSPAISAYYASNGAPGAVPGITAIRPDATPPAGTVIPFPLLAFIEYGFINADSQQSTGLDFTINVRTKLTNSITLQSSLDANYVIESSKTVGGVKQRFDDTLGPYIEVSAAGTPKWRGSWTNTFDFGGGNLSVTANYTKGIFLGAEDDGNVRGVCALDATGNPGSLALYRDGKTIVTCRSKDFISVDLAGSIDVSDQFSLYANVNNALAAKAPYDPSTYGAYQYNSAYAQSGVIGRTYRVGARVKF